MYVESHQGLTLFCFVFATELAALEYDLSWAAGSNLMTDKSDKL